MCIASVCFQGCDVKNSKTNLIFLIRPFFYITEEPGLKCKHLENKKSFQGEIKSIFPLFKGHPAAKNYLRPESEPLSVGAY